MKIKFLTVIITALVIIFDVCKAETAKEIIKKANELVRANSSYSELTIKIVKPDWSRELEMKIWSLEPNYSLLLTTKPAKDKGTVFLKRKKLSLIHI